MIRHGNHVEGSHVRPSTVNGEITALIGLLNLAAENGLLEKIPATRKLKESEDHLVRERILEADEYKALIDTSPRWLQRVIIAAYEGCLSRVDLLTLTTDEIHRKRPEAAVVKVTSGRNKTKTRQKLPISPAFAEMLDELDRERKKLTSLHSAGAVFTPYGKPIRKNTLRKAFDAAKKQAKLKDFHFTSTICGIAPLLAGPLPVFRRNFENSLRVIAADQFASGTSTHLMSTWSRLSRNICAGIVTTFLCRN